jgi:DNA-binding NarL/FixJ family response regulator
MGISPKMGASPAQIRVLSVDDHALIREGIAALIANQKDMRWLAKHRTDQWTSRLSRQPPS